MFHLLVVDDDLNTRKFLQALLITENYTVTTAQNGKAALEILDKEHIDLVILDVMMPEMDGYAFTEAIRASHSNLPILMISAKQLPADRKKGFIVGTDDYMTKPVDEEEMLLRIKALLRRARIVCERKITIGSIVLDYDKITVTIDGSVQRLPQKEFCLLYKLLSYPGRTFTRMELMDEIWGVSSESSYDTITTHITRLRKRFENVSEFEIESVRGIGYRAVRKK